MLLSLKRIPKVIKAEKLDKTLRTLQKSSASCTNDFQSTVSNCKTIRKMTSHDNSSDKPYEKGSNSIAFVTTPDETIAKKLAHSIISEKLAACVNIIPQLTSIYLWEGKVNEDSEVLMMIKTDTNLVNELTKYVKEHHPYSVAEVITVPIEAGNAQYLDWVKQSVKH